MRPSLILLPVLIPIAVKWVEWQEGRILRLGRALTDEGLADARRMGVSSPEKIRVLAVDRIPVLNGAFIGWLSRIFPAISSKTVGLSLRYGIYVRNPWSEDRHLVAHECVHTGQYERVGGIAEFLREYFTGCIVDGYPASRMEQEAILRSASLEE